MSVNQKIADLYEELDRLEFQAQKNPGDETVAKRVNEIETELMWLRERRGW